MNKKIIDANPEFGVELGCVIPYAFYHHLNGTLDTVITCKGMKPFYYFTNRVEERYTERTIDNSIGLKSVPNKWLHGYKGSDLTPGILDYSEWVPPPYKEYFYTPSKFSKPVVVVVNKKTADHMREPTGYFSIECLNNIFNILTEKGYDIIYKRPKQTEYPSDINDKYTIQNGLDKIEANVEGIGLINDYDLCRYYKNVYLMDDILGNYSDNYNEAQLRLFSSAEAFVSISGGNAILCALFGKPVIDYITTSKETRSNYFSENSYMRKLSGSTIYPIVDLEKDILQRGHDYSKLYNTIKEIC